MSAVAATQKDTILNQKDAEAKAQHHKARRRNKKKSKKQRQEEEAQRKAVSRLARYRSLWYTNVFVVTITTNRR